MSGTEILTFVGIAAAIIVTQLGRHPFTLHRFFLPLLLAGGVACHHLTRGVLTTSGAEPRDLAACPGNVYAWDRGQLILDGDTKRARRIVACRVWLTLGVLPRIGSRAGHRSSTGRCPWPVWWVSIPS